LRDEGVWKTIVVDPAAPTSEASKPAFMTPPPGSKPYHGFPLIEETRWHGWCYGAVTDFLEADSEAGCSIGDGFVEAPDGSRAGLMWNVDPEPKFAVVEGPSGSRWGLFHFTIPEAIASVRDLQQTFWRMVPVLEQLYQRLHPPVARQADGSSEE
jgi:hypothetical protein